MHKIFRNTNTILATVLGILIVLTVFQQTTFAQSLFPKTHKPENTRSSSLETNSTTHNATIGRFLTYQNSTYGLRMQYPSNWEVLPPFVLALENEGNRIVEFVLLSNKLDPLGSRIADLSISVENVSKYLDTNTMKIKSETLQEYVSGKIAFINSQGSSILSLTYVRGEPTEISGLPAWRIEYTSSGVLYETTTYVIKDNRLFTFDFYSDQLKAPEMLPIAQKMIASFQFI